MTARGGAGDRPAGMFAMWLWDAPHANARITTPKGLDSLRKTGTTAVALLPAGTTDKVVASSDCKNEALLSFLMGLFMSSFNITKVTKRLPPDVY